MGHGKGEGRGRAGQGREHLDEARPWVNYFIITEQSSANYLHFFLCFLIIAGYNFENPKTFRQFHRVGGSGQLDLPENVEGFATVRASSVSGGRERQEWSVRGSEGLERVWVGR